MQVYVISERNSGPGGVNGIIQVFASMEKAQAFLKRNVLHRAKVRGDLPVQWSDQFCTAKVGDHLDLWLETWPVSD